MKKMLLVSAVLLLLLAGCQSEAARKESESTTLSEHDASIEASASERASIEASLSLFVAQQTGPSGGYRKGFLFIEEDLIRFGGQLYTKNSYYIAAAENMVYLGEISATVDGVPQNDFENARELDPGTRLYRLPDNTSYIIPVPAGEEPTPGEPYPVYRNPYGLPELGLEEIPVTLIPYWEVEAWPAATPKT